MFIWTKIVICCMLFLLFFFNSLAKAEALQKQGPTTATVARDIYEKVRHVFSWYFRSPASTFFLYSLTFPLISVAVRCYNWREGANSNWTWSNTAYSGWYYTGDTSECSLFMEIPWELRSSEKTWIFYLAIQLSDCERVRSVCNSGLNSPGSLQS